MSVTRRLFLQSGAAGAAYAAAPDSTYRQHFHDDHEALLPDWGPYSNRYMGIAHVADRQRGLRFDLSVFPGYYRRKITIPHGRWESDFHPWEAAADLSYYSFRHQLEWKDRVYCDASYSRMDDHARLIRCECVNATSRHQNLVLNYIAYLNYPRPRYEATLPAGAKWIDALDYTQLRFATPRPQDNLNYDGFWRGEALGDAFTGGSGLGRNFGRDRGDTVEYSVEVPHEIGDAALVMRYRVARRGVVRVAACGQTHELRGTGEFAVKVISLGAVRGRLDFSVVSEGGAAVDLDGFALVPIAAAPQVKFAPEAQDVTPETLTPGPRANSVLIKYKTLDRWYGIAWNHAHSQVRQFLCGELDNFFRYRVQDHVSTVLRGPGEGHFTNVFLRPIPIAPQSRAVVHGMVCEGTRAEVEAATSRFSADESIYNNARRAAVSVSGLPQGKPLEFSQQRLAACTLSNVFYPIYTRRHYVKHITPGRFWSMLYSWDAGFMGLGLLEVDVNRSIDVLNSYLTPPGDQQAAFIHHGTPIPVQIYQFLEIWNRTQSRELLQHYYPRLRQYHMFLAGRQGSSTTRRLKSQLLQTWDYFYNTGWDDYPPQQHMHRNKLQRSLAAPVTTAHAIRTAKMLSAMAHALGDSTDLAAYRDDIAVWTDSLQRYSWDEEAGYFGYVKHDDAGQPTGILRHESGQNFNMGMCGAYPFFAGICTAAQEKRIVDHMMSPKRLWTRIGMTTVDQSAAYYTPDGYWNGAVWFPHQWFVWKALLDLGYAEEAHRIANTALELWRQEVDDTYGCFEHFMVESGRGAGWHHFTSLTAPILGWYAAYYRPGRMTTGFDTWVETCAFSAGNTKLDARLLTNGAAGRDTVVLCTLAPGKPYRATVDGAPARTRTLASGALEIRIANAGGPRKLVVG